MGQQDNPEDLLISPYQPAAQLIEPQVLANRTLCFLDSWFREYPWLHYSPEIQGVLCFYCVSAFKHNTSTMAKNTEQTFISQGFRNWKKGRESFGRHAGRKAHIFAVDTHTHTHRSVRMQLCTESANAQEAARSVLRLWVQ